jgi:hypothetical protein
MADWEVDHRTFAEITRKLNFFPTLGLFASRLDNRKYNLFYSYRFARTKPGCSCFSHSKSNH